jgi:apolipoprotein N-acyltransferase
MARMGADFLVNMGNDAWTPGTWALRQHLTVNVMRAVEVGLWYVIANNSGISGIVDHHGVVRSCSMPRTSACLVGEVRPDARPSFYAKHGDIFAGICVLAAIAGLSAKSKRGERGEK